MIPLLLAIMGPTASGKTELAEKLARELDAQLVSADAFQVYRGMDIGTGKSPNKHRYDLVDIADPREQFGLGKWVQLAHQHLERFFEAGKNVILVGGTGLYVRALMEEYSGMGDEPDPELRRRILQLESEIGSIALYQRLVREHPDAAGKVVASNPLRIRRAWERVLSPATPPLKLPPFRRFKVALDPPRDLLRRRITPRVKEMMDQGWPEEVRSLKDAGIPIDAPGLKAIGYRLLYSFLQGEVGFNEVQERITVLTHQYAKRQRTWLRSEPDLKFLPWTDSGEQTLQSVVALIVHN